MRLLTLGGLALLCTAGLSTLLAQSVDGVDVQAVKKRAADLATEAQAFVEQVKDRGDRFREDAATVQTDGLENMRRVASTDLPKGPAGAVDFDEIVQGAAGNIGANGGEAPRFIVFASLSMPENSLRQLVRDTADAGGVVVFRGFPNNSAKDFVARLSKVVDQGQLASIGIDPRLFRAFEVQAVPTYVTVSSDFDLCAGFSCQTKLPPYDRMIGNVTVEYALTTFAEGNGPGARIAAVALSNMKRSR
ncbi:type-F conjugative transfer system pilin assembly protein TrbC [Sphingomonas sp. ABOLE]|jgi:conjugal transfer pilus assembly protein TrbC|uniref:type-F conjugative transfer system pilin assembly protein TrbC n=1 Tax=Sphingomonas sp. ABOLE TaxID=1985878 RepID=UPI000F7E038C|nr:type-F conjugative transfer system pilin assembly protein TrbC [Sphingomonas sp. ABOLE]RSV41778.1 type-F conjugative transfer system pilin assembly protein TrbC [Sphingomonas sp. ABOLE]